MAAIPTPRDNPAASLSDDLALLGERYDVVSRFNSSPRRDWWHGRTTRSASCVSPRNANATERGAFGLQTAVRSNLV